MKKSSVLFLILTILITACSKDDTLEKSFVITKAKQTVIVYMSAENNLSYVATSDIDEMVKGSLSLPDSCNLIAFIDSAGTDKYPYILRIKDGEKVKDPAYATTEDFYASDPTKMYDVLKWIMDRYPSDAYSLVLWGHAGGWLMSDSVAWTGSISSLNKVQRAYGIDTGNNTEGSIGKWINIPSLATVLTALPHKFKYILADCCNFQCIESAYELRQVADYIIGTPAETPNAGAPYTQILPSLFSEKDDFYKDIADIYYNQNGTSNKVPMSVIKTSEMENLAQATSSMVPYLTESNVVMPDTMVYYLYSFSKVMYDMNDIMQHFTPSTEAYNTWKNALNKAVIYKRYVNKWTADHVYFTDFNLTEAKYGGVSMFVPLQQYDLRGLSFNADIKKMAWYYAIGMDRYK